MASSNAQKDVQTSPQTAKDALRPLVVVSCLFIVLDTIFVILRFISRNFIKKVEFGWDDLLIVPAWICNIGLCITGLAFAHYETKGNPVANEVQIDPVHVVPVLKAFYALVIVGPVSYTLPKVSLLSLYLRIFTTRLFRSVAYVLMSIILVFWIIYTFVWAFSCSPPKYFWEQGYGTKKGHCLSPDKLTMANLPTNVVLNLCLLILPLPAVWTLKISKFRKVAFTLLFLTGTIAFAASIVRLVYTSRWTLSKITPASTTPVAVLVIVEPGLYLIAACLPALYPLMALVAPRWLQSNIDRGVLAARRRSRPAVIRRPEPLPRRGTSQRLRRGNSFSRLVENDWRPVSSSGGGSGKLPRSTTPQELEYGGRAGGVAQSLPLDNVGGMLADDIANGRMGIIVQTDIEVTQSERIEHVLGI